MAKVLIAYSTTEGHTRSIAQCIEGLVAAAGHEPFLVDAAEHTPLPDSFQAAIVGGSVHQEHHQTSLTSFVRNRELLTRVPSAFFSVSLAAAVPDVPFQQEAQGYVDAFLAETGWRPLMTACFAGALKHVEYDYVRKMLLHLLAQKLGHGVVVSRDVSYTDWAAVSDFVDKFLQAVTAHG